jgi:hypothetical protein
MKIDGHSFPVSMIGGSTTLIKKYEKKREREDITEQGVEFDSHWECLFFKYFWDHGMKLLSADTCPQCCDRPIRLLRE